MNNVSDIIRVASGTVNVISKATASAITYHDLYVASGGTVIAVIQVSTNIFKNPRVAAAFAVLGAILTYIAIRLWEKGTFAAQILELASVKEEIQGETTKLNSEVERLKENISQQEKIKEAIKSETTKLNSEVERLKGNISQQEQINEKIKSETNKLNSEVDRLKINILQQEQINQKAIQLNQEAIQQSALIGTLLSDVKGNLQAMQDRGIELDEDSKQWIEKTQQQVAFVNALAQQSISSMDEKSANVMESMKAFVEVLKKDSAKVAQSQLDVIESLRKQQAQIKKEIKAAALENQNIKLENQSIMLENQNIKMEYETIKREISNEKKENEQLKETNKKLLHLQQLALEKLKDASQTNHASAQTNRASAQSLNNIITQVGLNLPTARSSHRRSSSSVDTITPYDNGIPVKT